MSRNDRGAHTIAVGIGPIAGRATINTRTKKEQLPLTQEIENFLRDTMKAALKIKDDIHYMRQPPNRVAIDVGEAELGLLPGILQQVSFEHQGKVETGLIEEIDPPDWEKRGKVPDVYVVLSPGE
jgi:hypothetical protein